MYNPIKVWDFDSAPKEFRELSDIGGDEDWLVEVPEYYAGRWIPWMEVGSGFGVCKVREYDHPKNIGWKIFIGAHA